MNQTEKDYISNIKIEKQEVFWVRWLLSISILLILIGICFSILIPFLFPDILNLFYEEITNNQISSMTNEELRYNNLLSGVIGSTIIGWGLLISLLGRQILKNPFGWEWTAISISIAIWYIFDTTISILAGSLLNVILNSILLLLILPTLIAKRKEIYSGFKKI